jgi:transposase InsO family protein
MGSVQLIFVFLRALLRSQGELAAENLALRQQLAVLKERRKRPRLRKRDRIFWVWLSRLWTGWRSALLIVQPDTVVAWHRQGWKLYWRWKSLTGKVGRPRIDAEIRKLIRRMCRQNPSWGAPRIHSELQLLGYDVSETTVDKYMVRHRKPPSQTWRTFLDNHVRDIVAVDFFTVPTATFRILFCFIVLRHHRRLVAHFNVTAHPTAEWTAQQIIEAFPEDQAPRFLIRDRDSIYGEFFRQRVKHMGIEEAVIAPRSPWQNPYVERLNGSIRRECLDHVIILNERHLRRILAAYFHYYHSSRAHLSLDRNSPIEREIEPPERGRVVAIPKVGGLHHRYARAA